MKKLICLFLMLWLPLFTGSAWAMSTQMQLGKLQSAMPESAAEPAAHPPCHEMQPGEQATHSPAPSTQDHNQHCNGHNCFACGVCIYASSYTTPMAQTLFTPLLSHAKPVQFDSVFASQLYPPALKPPIAA